MKRSVLVGIVMVCAVSLVVVASNGAGSQVANATNSYAIKYTCGEFGKAVNPAPPQQIEGPVKTGNYQTIINLHNPNLNPVAFRKKAILLYAGDQPRQIEPGDHEVRQKPSQFINRTLPYNYGMRIDCQDIRQVLLGPSMPTPAPPPPVFIEGYVVIETAVGPEPPLLDVTAVYTSHSYNIVADTLTREGFSEQVLPIQPTRVAR